MGAAAARAHVETALGASVQCRGAPAAMGDGEGVDTEWQELG